MDFEKLFKDYLNVETKLAEKTRKNCIYNIKAIVGKKIGVTLFDEKNIENAEELVKLIRNHRNYKTYNENSNRQLNQALNYFLKFTKSETLKSFTVQNETKGMSLLTEYLNEADTKIKELQDIYGEDSLVAFRGESADFGITACTPSFFRENEGNITDLMLLETVQDYDVTTKMSKIDLAIHSQHYYQMSKMLDISFNILPSLFFTCNEKQDEDAKIYIFGFPKSYSPSSEYVNRFYEKTVMKKPVLNLSINFKVLRHSMNNARIKKQQGGFILFHGDNFSPMPRCYYRDVTIKHKHKSEILKILKLFFGFNEISVYPEPEHRATLLKENLKNAHHTSFSKNLDFFTNEIEQAFSILKDEISWEILQCRKQKNSKNFEKEIELKLRTKCDLYSKHIKSKLKEIEGHHNDEDLNFLYEKIDKEIGEVHFDIKEKLYLKALGGI